MEGGSGQRSPQDSVRVLHFAYMLLSQANHPAAGTAGISRLFAIERLCPGMPEPGRSAALCTR